MILFFVGTLGAIIALVGWFGFHSVIPLLIGTALYIIETIMEWEKLNFNAKIFDIVILAIGSVIAIISASAPWYVGGMIAIAIYNLILSVIGIVKMFVFLKTYSLLIKHDKLKKYGIYNILYGEDIMYQPLDEDIDSSHENCAIHQNPSHHCADTNADIKSRTEESTPPKKRFSAAIPILSVILLFCCMLCFDFYFRAKDKNEYRALEEVVSKLESEKLALNDKISALESEKQTLNNEISALNRKISGLDYAVYALENQISKNEDKLNFYDEFVVFVIDDGSNWYHKYGCELFEGDFWAYNVDNAEHKGYIPCKVCFD